MNKFMHFKTAKVAHNATKTQAVRHAKQEAKAMYTKNGPEIRTAKQG